MEGRSGSQSGGNLDQDRGKLHLASPGKGDRSTTSREAEEALLRRSEDWTAALYSLMTQNVDAELSILLAALSNLEREVISVLSQNTYDTAFSR